MRRKQTRFAKEPPHSAIRHKAAKLQWPALERAEYETRSREFWKKDKDIKDMCSGESVGAEGKAIYASLAEK